MQVLVRDNVLGVCMSHVGVHVVQVKVHRLLVVIAQVDEHEHHRCPQHLKGNDQPSIWLPTPSEPYFATERQIVGAFIFFGDVSLSLLRPAPRSCHAGFATQSERAPTNCLAVARRDGATGAQRQIENGGWWRSGSCCAKLWISSR